MERNLNESYRRLRKWPSQRFSEELINSLLAILRSVSDFLDNRYFSIYQKIGSVGSNRIKEHLPLKNMLGQKRKCSLFGLETHNNSEHLSPASDFTSSDNYSSITEFTNFSMNSTSADSRKVKRRNKVRTRVCCRFVHRASLMRSNRNNPILNETIVLILTARLLYKTGKKSRSTKSTQKYLNPFFLPFSIIFAPLNIPNYNKPGV